MKLLYAEDEPALSEAVVDYLTYQNYIVDAVYNGTDAYEYAISGDYDGIILDIMMPGQDGLTVLSELRKNGCKTPVLLLTAKTQETFHASLFRNSLINISSKMPPKRTTAFWWH